MRIPLSELSGQAFDVAVIGAGVNGSAAAQHLAAAGYSVLLVDRGDFSSGASSRSSRLLHCGLRYLAPGRSMWNFVRHPGQIVTALGMAKQGMEARSQFARETPERIEGNTFFFPIHPELPYRPWQLDLAFAMLRALEPRGTPLDYGRVDVDEARAMPLLGWLRDFDRIKGIVRFREYRFEWPERVVMDTVLDAQRMGAVVRNHTPAVGLARNADDSWTVTLGDGLVESSEAVVQAKTILNMAGTWIDKVNRLAKPEAGRRITGTKGIHVMVRLPPECRSFGIFTLNRVNEPIFIAPWRGLHYIGPTETLYEGDFEDLYATEEEIAWQLDEANHLLPGANFKRSDVLFTWAGVRPLTYDPAQPKGARARLMHDLTDDGMPNMWALTAGPIMTHRSAGEEACAEIAKHVAPSGPPQKISYAAKLFPDNQNSPPLMADDASVKLADLTYSAEHEQPANLVDLLFQRTGVGWTATMGRGEARKAAETVAEVLGWDAARIDSEVAAYHAHLKKWHGVGGKAGG
jgi:glycerol-3-phosphate dehydrogenase